MIVPDSGAVCQRLGQLFHFLLLVFMKGRCHGDPFIQDGHVLQIVVHEFLHEIA